MALQRISFVLDELARDLAPAYHAFVDQARDALDVLRYRLGARPERMAPACGIDSLELMVDLRTVEACLDSVASFDREGETALTRLEIALQALCRLWVREPHLALAAARAE